MVRQPANTFSNAGFVAAGLLIAWHAGARPTVASVGLPPPGHRHGLHRGPTRPRQRGDARDAVRAGRHLDMLSMYLIAAFAAAYATHAVAAGRPACSP